MPELAYFLAIRPLTRNSECGDTGLIKEFENKVFIGILDVLGSGKDAQKIVSISKDFLEKNYRKDLVEIMKGLHECIKGSRGAVAGVCHLDLKTGELKYVGIGNITTRIFGSSTKRIISRSGIIGYMMPSPREKTMKLYASDILVLYTDGVKNILH